MVDGRAACGKQYELAALLVLLVLAKSTGMQSLLRAGQWVADQETRLRESLQLTWRRTLYTNTYKYALARLGSQQVKTVIAAWLVQRHKAAVEKSLIVWLHSPASCTFIWLLMAKRLRAPTSSFRGI